ncbi:MAG: hypothetical protein RR334_03815 [Clostridia bacterium]
MKYFKNEKAHAYELDEVSKEELFQKLFSVGDYSAYMLNKCKELREFSNHKLIKCFMYLKNYTGIPVKALEAIIVEAPQLLLPRTTDFKYNYDIFEKIYYENKTSETPQVPITHREVLKVITKLSPPSIEGIILAHPKILDRSPLDLYVGFLTWRFNTYVPFTTLYSLARRDVEALYIRRDEYIKIRRVYKDKFANKFLDIAHAFIREPRLLYIPLETVAQRFDDLWNGLNISRHDLYKVMLICPTIFTLPAEDIIRKVNYFETIYGETHFHATVAFKKCPQVIMYSDEYLIYRLAQLREYNITYYIFGARPSMLISPEYQFPFKYMLTRGVSADNYFANMYGYGIAKMYARARVLTELQGKNFRREDMRLTNNRFAELNCTDAEAMEKYPLSLEKLQQIYVQYIELAKVKNLEMQSYWHIPILTRVDKINICDTAFTDHLPLYYLNQLEEYSPDTFDKRTNVILIYRLFRIYGLSKRETDYLFRVCPEIANIHIKDLVKNFYRFVEYGVNITDISFIIMNNPYLLLKESGAMTSRMIKTYLRSFFAADPLDVLHTQIYKI